MNYTLTVLALPLLFLPAPEVLPMPQPKSELVALVGEPKGKAADWLKMTGIGVMNDKGEVVVKNVAYAVTFAGRKPGDGRTIAFAGTFDGSVITCNSWSRPLDGRGPFVDFTAEGSIKLVAPGKDVFMVHSLKMPLQFIPDDIQDAVEKGSRIRVSGGLVSRADGFDYLVTKMEAVK